MEESPLTFKYLNFLRVGLCSTALNKVFFVTDILNLLNCYMKEFGIANSKCTYNAYLLTERRTKLSVSNVNQWACFVRDFTCHCEGKKMEKKYSAYKMSNGHYHLHEKQWWTTVMCSEVSLYIGFPLHSHSEGSFLCFIRVSSIQNLNASLNQEHLTELMRSCWGLPGVHDSSSSPYPAAAATLTFLRGFLGAPHNPRSSSLTI